MRGIDPAALAHLEAFATSRRGVEIYVEPKTTVTEATVVLVAHDGEWTRRRINEPRDAAELGARLGVPVYDVHATGYPPRMRAWTASRSGSAAKDRNPFS
ncbi:MAG TPA: oxidoreductase [Mycobacteriales bacterium]|nr:oxidoreductase [Mycobacteriales bacterium]